MEKKIAWTLLTLLLAVQFAGCAGQGGVDWSEYKKPGITILGAAAGGAVGSMFGSGIGRGLAVATGALAGGALGYWIAERMEEEDKDAVSYALSEYEEGQTLHWQNNETNEEFAITPTNTYSENNQECRDFTLVRYEDGDQQQSEGSACREDDGQWTITESG